MKAKNGKMKIVFGVILLFLAANLSFAEKAIGFELGEKLHWSEGNPFNAHSFALSLDFSRENFGIKPYFGFSFSTAVTSNMDTDNTAVTYKYETKTSVETLGVKPYFIFRNSEKSKSYIGILFELNFNQSEREAVKITTNGTSSKTKYITSELGLFVGNKWNASEKCAVFAECNFSSRLFANTTTYEIGGKAVENYQSSMVGGGGTSSWALYVTPRLGIAYRW